MQRVDRGCHEVLALQIISYIFLSGVLLEVPLQRTFIARWSLTHRRDGQICKSKLPLPKDLQEAISRLTYRNSEGSLHGVLAAFDRGHRPQRLVENDEKMQIIAQ